MKERDQPTPQTAPGAPSPGAPPVYGPPIPTPPVNPVAGLTGRARWEEMVRRQMRVTSAQLWGHDFNTWVLGLQDDPNDPEYNLMLAQARQTAQKYESGAASADKAQPSNVGTPFLQAGQTGHMAAREPSAPNVSALKTPQMDAGITPGGPGALRTPAMDAGIGGNGKTKAARNETEEDKRAMAEIRAMPSQVFKGTPTSTEGLATPTGEDALLSQFMAVNGKSLNGPQAEMAKRSGAFVFMGIQTQTTKSGLQADQDQWMYVQDADAGLAALGSTKIKEYQGALKQEQTGIPDNDLQGLWHQAVKQAALYAQAGLKMSVQEIFDSYIRGTVAARGGGGRSTIGDTPEDVAAIDYYKALMAVLGDISGLPTPGGRG